MNLPLGDGLSSKEGSRGREGRRAKQESDETEFLVTWTGAPMKPNTPTRAPRSTRTSKESRTSALQPSENYRMDRVSLDDTTACPIRNMNEYMNKESVNRENQESETFESGCGPRYLVKQQGEVLREYVQELFHKLARVETKSHDVVHEIVQEVISNRYLFFVTVQRRRKKSGRNKIKEGRAKAGSRRSYRALLPVVLIYSNLETAQGMEGALRQFAEVNQQTLQGVQTQAEEIRNSAASGSQREAGLTQAFQ